MRVLAVLVALVACAALLFAVGGSSPEISSTFKMKFDGKYVGGVTKISGLGDSTRVITAVVQGKTIKSAGTTSFGTDRGFIVIKQLNNSALSNNAALAEWYAASHAAANGVEKNFIIDIMGENNHVTAAYLVYHAKPVSFTTEVGSDGKIYNVFKFTATLIERDHSVV